MTRKKRFDSFRKVMFIIACILSLNANAGTTGSIRGSVIDKDNNAKPAAGVTIVARSPSLIGEIVEITSGEGFYTLSGLPPGKYTLTAIFAGARAERSDILVEINRTINVNLTISSSASSADTYNIEGTSPSVDVAGNTVGQVLTKEYIENVPLGAVGRSRDLSEALAASPSAAPEGARSTQAGVGFGGGTQYENQYIIDGMNAGAPGLGILNGRLALEFIDNLEIKEGGYGPEFGKATGAIVNAVTKSGSNEFHGSAFAYYRPGFFQMAATPIDNRQAIQIAQEIDYYLHPGFEIGGPVVKDVLWFYAGYTPELRSQNTNRTFRWLDDTNGIQTLDGAGSPVWASSGAFAPYSDTYTGLSQSHQYLAKLTHLINDNNRQSLSVRGSILLHSGYGQAHFQNDDYRIGSQGNGNPNTMLLTIPPSNDLWTATYNFAGGYFDNKFKVDAMFGAHQEANLMTIDPVNDVPTLDYGQRENLRDLMDGTVPEACRASNDILDADNNTISRCPVRGFVKQGLGYTGNQTVYRFQEKIVFSNLFDFAGLHQLKYGVDFEQTLSNITRYWTGGSLNGYGWGGPNTWLAIRWAINGVVTEVVDSDDMGTTYAAFIGDTWNPTSNLVLNYGVRWDGQVLFGLANPADKSTMEPKMSIMDSFSPRAGLIWDFTSNGKGALRFNYARYTESIPLEFPEVAFAGLGVQLDFLSTSNCYPGGANGDGSPKVSGETALDRLAVTNPIAQCQNYFGFPTTANDNLVQPGIKSGYTDELILGVDYELFPSWVFGVTGVYRSIGRVVDNMNNGNNNYTIVANPGDFDEARLADIRHQIAESTDPKTIEELNNLMSLAKQINALDRPKKDVFTLQFKVDKKLSDNFLLNASYVLGWVWGNFNGSGFGSGLIGLSGTGVQAQQRLNNTGFLSQDVRHRIKMAGFYNFALKDVGIAIPLSFVLGSSMYLQSGRPYSAFGNDPNNGPIKILPIGTAGRMPWNWNVDLNLAAKWNFSDELSAEVFATLYNVFNTQIVTSVDEVYTSDFVRPIVGGKKDQLADLRNTAGNPVTVNPNYGNATSYSEPFGLQIGARVKF